LFFDSETLFIEDEPRLAVVGDKVGNITMFVGTKVGTNVGTNVDDAVGTNVGDAVGTNVGDAVGTRDG
jgi:hypothetical protein